MAAPCGVLNGLSPGFGTGYTKRAETNADSPAVVPNRPRARPSIGASRDQSPAAATVAVVTSRIIGTPQPARPRTRPQRSSTPRTPETTCRWNAVWS